MTEQESKKKVLSDKDIKVIFRDRRSTEKAVQSLSKIIDEAQESGSEAVKIPTRFAVQLLYALKYVGAAASGGKNDGTDFKAADTDPSDLPPTDVDW